MGFLNKSYDITFSIDVFFPLLFFQISICLVGKDAMELPKPKSDTEEVPESPSGTQTSEVRLSEDTVKDEAEHPSEKGVISSEKTCDDGELSSVPIEDEQTSNVTPDASVETSEKSNEDKQDLSTDVKQQESTSISNEDDSGQTANGVPKNSAERLAKSLTGDNQGNSVRDAIQENSTDICCENADETSSKTTNDHSRPENLTPEKAAKRLTKSSTGNKQGDSVKDAIQEKSTDISHENIGQTSCQGTEDQDQPENVTPKKSAAVQILEQVQTGGKQVTPVKDVVEQISTEVSPKDGDAGQTLCETTEEQPQPGNGTSKKSTEIEKELQEKLLNRDKQDLIGAPKDLIDIVEISLQPGAKGEESDVVKVLTNKQDPKDDPKNLDEIVEISFLEGSKSGVNDVRESTCTDAQKASSQRDEGQSEESEKETGSLSQSSGVKVPEKNSQLPTDSSAGNVKIAVNKKNLKAINLSQVQTVTAASGQKYSMIQKTSALGSPIYESVDTKEQYYWVPQSSLPNKKLSGVIALGIGEGLRLGEHYALVPLERGKSLKHIRNPEISYRKDELRREIYREPKRERLCSVPHCNSSSHAYPDLSFFNFPQKEPRYV